PEHGARVRCINPTAVDDDELRLTESWIVERRLEKKWIDFGYTVGVAESFKRVNVNSHAESAGFPRDVAEDVILKRLVLGMRGFSTGGVFRIHRACGGG